MPNTFVKIANVTVGSGGAANIEFTSIPQTFTHLKIITSLRTASGGQAFADCNLTINGNSSAIYDSQIYYTNNGTNMATARTQGQTNGAWFAEANGSTSLANVFGANEMYFINYTASVNKIWFMHGSNENNTTSGNILVGGGNWNNTAAITSILFFATNPSGNFAQYSTATLYGIKSS
jgi:hypothetical protein